MNTFTYRHKVLYSCNFAARFYHLATTTPSLFVTGTILPNKICLKTNLRHTTLVLRKFKNADVASSVVKTLAYFIVKCSGIL